ncbi:MAG: ABC transporter permease [Agriterribacter sp.]
MFKNYFKIAWRNIRKNKLYSFVNIAGLTIGIASCLLIGIYVWQELTYDSFHKNADRIARLTMEYQVSDKKEQLAVTGSKAGPEFKRQFPQIEAYVRTMKAAMSIANGNKAIDEKNVLYADADFFSVFSFSLLRGDSKTVLNAPLKIVLTKKAAIKYFGEQDPVGRTLRINGAADYEVTGIAADAPVNSQIQYDVIVSFSTLNASQQEKWTEANYITYLLLKDGKQIGALNDQLQLYTRRMKEQEFHLLNNGTDYITFHAEALKDVHLYSAINGGLEAGGNITYIYILIAVAILILLIACVNYTNLATAQSVSRSTEIGIRKVMGAGKIQLLKQFLGESFILTLLSLVLGFILAAILLPSFNAITGKNFPVTFFLSPVFITGALLLSFIVSMLAGSYPAFVLSNTKLVSILKSGLRMSQSGGGLRKVLIIFQFVIAVFLSAATLIVLNQVSYIQRKDLGYQRDQVMVLPVDYKTKEVYEPLKYDIGNNPNVISVTGSYEVPTSIGWGDGITADDGKGKKELSLNATPVDLGYLKTMGMQLVAGRDFTRNDFMLQDTSENYSHYRASYILNEKAVKDLGWTPEQAVGKTISKGVDGTVVGVVKDFNFESLHTPIGPLLIFLDTSLVQQMYIKVKPAQAASTIASLEKIWRSRVAHRPFDYHFLDDDFNALYKSEQRTAKLFSLFSGLAIALACLGLFALAAFTTIQRTKEIGIRKVLGANIASIVLLIAKQFLVLIVFAIVIASPLAWMAGNSWLQNFAYRTNIGWWIFAVSGASAVLIALATVCYHAIKVAVANPVKSLRTE